LRVTYTEKGPQIQRCRPQKKNGFTLSFLIGTNLWHCEWKPHEVDPEAMKKDITRSDLTLLLSRIINDPAIPTRQRLSAARQLSTLNGWIGDKKPQKDEHSILAGIMKAIDGSSTGLPSERNGERD
jgi:hypothetical protein